jgi:2-isopropylmalate synthase
VSPTDPNRVLIFDTTLRDGEQSPGCSMGLTEKLRIAHALEDLGVDIIEAGFPAASIGDFEAVQAIAGVLRESRVAALARATRDDIERAFKAIERAAKPRIHVFLATSAIHREFKLNMAKTEIIDRAVAGVQLARSLCADVEFSPEDASRTEYDFLTEVVEAVIAAGATTINVPDTVGYTTPEEYGALFKHLTTHVRGAERVVFSTHCHDDLGLAVANSLSAVRNGARQVECTIGGIGERAGNAALEEIVMALATRGAFFQLSTGIRTPRLLPMAKLVSGVIGQPIARNKAIVGENAFAHESGIHQHGMLKNQACYEIMKPETVGAVKSTLVLGKHSGRHAFRAHVEAMGFELEDAALDEAFVEFKRLADRKKNVYDGDIEALVLRAGTAHHGGFELQELKFSSGEESSANATVSLQLNGGRIVTASAVGDGPIDAAFRAIVQITGSSAKLKRFELRSTSEGEDAQGEATVTLAVGETRYRGVSLSTNIIEAGVLAIVDALNQIPLSVAPATRLTQTTVV